MASATLQGQTSYQFLGVNLRQDRIIMADQDLARAINADLHTAPGTIFLRLGRAKQFTTGLTDLILRGCLRFDTTRYQVAGQSLYRDQVKILNGVLNSNLVTTLVPYRPLNDSTSWIYIADDSLMRKDDGTNVRDWGLTAPGAAVSVAAGASTGLTGDYKVQITYVRVVSSVDIQESNPNTISSAVTLSNQDLNVTGIAASTDPQVTHINVYRTVAGGGAPLFDTQITNGTTSVLLSKADTALTTLIALDNDRPPNAAWAVKHNDQTFLCREAANPHYVRFSKRFKPDAFPSANFIEVGSIKYPLKCLVSNGGVLGAFNEERKFRIEGNAISGYVSRDHISARGTRSPFSVIPTSKGTMFLAKDGIFRTDWLSEDQQLASSILALFFDETVNDFPPINWAVADTISAIEFKNRLYMALPLGDSLYPDHLAVLSYDTNRWYFYQYPSEVRSLCYEQDLDKLVSGNTDGFAYNIETGFDDAGTNITLEAETKDYFGIGVDLRGGTAIQGATPTTLKLFQYYKVDAELGKESLTLEFYVDGVLIRSTTITGDRTKTLLEVPQGTMGFQWRMKFKYTGNRRIKITGVSAWWEPLEPV